jgi:ureidoacrylate peracid hydrolase
MQRDYCCEGGLFDKMGFDLEIPRHLASRLNGFLNKARKVVKYIIHVKMTIMPELASPAMKEQYERAGLQRKYDSSYGDFFGVTPVEGEMIIPKYRYSGFVSTYLDKLLRANGIKTVVVVGLSTNVCVESTVRDAFMLDYHVVVPADMTETSSPEEKEWSLRTIDTFFGEVVESKDLLICWGLA